MEFSETLESVKQEIDFFNEGLVSNINDLHVDTLNRVNGNDDIMDLVYKRATIEEVMD
jgi:poly(A) polymerase Pap1